MTPLIMIMTNSLVACTALLFLTVHVALHAQDNGPWNSPLRMAWSTDGRTFAPSTVFQDSSGVPCVIRWRGDSLVCVFQWFREPRTAPTWDRVAVKFSADAGVTWSEPTPIVVHGLPQRYQRPFDPTVVVVNGRLRLYFSSSDGMPVGGLTSIVNTYSAISDDGVKYTFEPDARYDIADRPVIDPAVVFFNDLWHYSAPRGAPQEGAHHATSTDGLTFTPAAPYPSDMQHNWTGNYTRVNDTTLRFYGSGPQLWFAESADAMTWGPYQSTGVNGGDPSVVALAPGRWLMIYVGPRYVSSVDSELRETLRVLPNPTTDAIVIEHLRDTDIVTAVSITGDHVEPTLAHAPRGVYLIHVRRGTSACTLTAVKL
jgi:hypothetical protein